MAWLIVLSIELRELFLHLVEARAAGHAVPEDLHKRLLAYVRGLLDHTGDGGDLLKLLNQPGVVTVEPQ